ncbi:MBL fold metallo-hydrolase [Cryptosporangium aurantiacum]|uniref:Glyoxylase, beta-lactamase superfamily II n=1 Tax=Cryptosporangium aurantiacum TaxID=134849 RepID=A0A1M7JY83_9ACTN|nr:MBL fold metallo-hydrolase [Cryptosporangium aurantiacum]SHM57487.1 Glyoxylase, beta-lactamase superfamily II [Cryptosporangium aurantiacum]
MGAPTVTEVAAGVHFVEGDAVNWVVLTDGDALTLIDAGYPADVDAVRQSLDLIGCRPDQIAAVLITHGHVDHIGSLPALLNGSTPVYLSQPEVRHVHGEYREQATPIDVVRNLHRPGYLGWSLYLARSGALKHVTLPAAAPFPSDGPLNVPGRPIPVPTPGHTSGHTCYLLPDAGVILTGDTLVTGHPTSRIEGPQLLAPIFHHDRQRTVEALDTLEALDADIVLPGHGPVYRGSIREAAAQARERAA